MGEVTLASLAFRVVERLLDRDEANRSHDELLSRCRGSEIIDGATGASLNSSVDAGIRLRFAVEAYQAEKKRLATANADLVSLEESEI